MGFLALQPATSISCLEPVPEELQVGCVVLEGPAVLGASHVFGGHGLTEGVDGGRFAAGVVGVQDVAHRVPGEVPVDVAAFDARPGAVGDGAGDALVLDGRPVVAHAGVPPVVDPAAPVGGGVAVRGDGGVEGLGGVP